MLDRIERYYDEAPRSSARVEEFGSLRLFVGPAPSPYSGRPSGAAGDLRSELLALLVRQLELGVPRTLEWTDEVTPELAPAAIHAGMEVGRYPLLVLERRQDVRPADGHAIRIAAADDPDLGPARVAIDIGFDGAGKGDPAGEAYLRERIARGGP